MSPIFDTLLLVNFLAMIGFSGLGLWLVWACWWHRWWEPDVSRYGHFPWFRFLGWWAIVGLCVILLYGEARAAADRWIELRAIMADLQAELDEEQRGP